MKKNTRGKGEVVHFFFLSFFLKKKKNEEPILAFFICGNNSRPTRLELKQFSMLQRSFAENGT